MKTDLTNLDTARALTSNLRATFETPQGKESLDFIKEIGSWYPTVFDTIETNEVIARDANRRLIGTILTMLELSPEQIVELAKQGG